MGSSFILPPPCYPLSSYLILSKMSRRKFKATLTVIVKISKHLQQSSNESKLKSRILFSFSVIPMSIPLHLDFLKLRPPRIEEDIMDFALLIRSFFFILSTDLILTTQLDGESQQKEGRRPQHPSTNSGSTGNGSNQGQYPTTCYRASLIS